METDPADPTGRSPLPSAFERHIANRSMITQLAMHTGGNIAEWESKPLPDVFAYYREVSDILKKQQGGTPSGRVF